MAFNRPKKPEDGGMDTRDPMAPYNPFPASMSQEYQQRAESVDKLNATLENAAAHQSLIHQLTQKTAEQLQVATKQADQFSKTLQAGALVAINRMNDAIGNVAKHFMEIVKYGAQHTAEMEQLQQSYMRFARGVADAFAPVIRGMTYIFEALATRVKGFGTEAKWAIVGVTGAILAATAAVGLLTSGLAVATLVSAALNISLGGALLVIGLVGTAIAGIPIAMFAVNGATHGWENSVKNVLATIIDIAKRLNELGNSTTFKILAGAALGLPGLIWTKVLGNIGASDESRAQVDKWFSGGALTPSSRSRFEAGGQASYERIQSNIVPNALERIASATEKTAENTEKESFGVSGSCEEDIGSPYYPGNFRLNFG